MMDFSDNTIIVFRGTSNGKVQDSVKKTIHDPSSKHLFFMWNQDEALITFLKS